MLELGKEAKTYHREIGKMLMKRASNMYLRMERYLKS